MSRREAVLEVAVVLGVVGFALAAVGLGCRVVAPKHLADEIVYRVDEGVRTDDLWVTGSLPESLESCRGPLARPANTSRAILLTCHDGRRYRVEVVGWFGKLGDVTPISEVGGL